MVETAAIQPDFRLQPLAAAAGLTEELPLEVAALAAARARAAPQAQGHQVRALRAALAWRETRAAAVVAAQPARALLEQQMLAARAAQAQHLQLLARL